MNQNDLSNLKSAITFELGMTLTAMSNSNKYSTSDLMDIGGYIGANFTNNFHVQVDINDKEEIVKHLHSVYKQKFSTGLTSSHLDRVRQKYFELLQSDPQQVQNHLQNIIGSFVG